MGNIRNLFRNLIAYIKKQKRNSIVLIVLLFKFWMHLLKQFPNLFIIMVNFCRMNICIGSRVIPIVVQSWVLVKPNYLTTVFQQTKDWRNAHYFFLVKLVISTKPLQHMPYCNAYSTIVLVCEKVA